MPTHSISLEARERLRAQQNEEASAVAAHGAATARLDTAAARRNQVILAQEKVVAEAEARVAEAARKVVKVSGFERASVILGIPKGTLRRHLATAKNRAGSPASDGGSNR
jgi:regulator of protease activity HflC (stomatin/prohibitin superfamily)